MKRSEKRGYAADRRKHGGDVILKGPLNAVLRHYARLHERERGAICQIARTHCLGC